MECSSVLFGRLLSLHIVGAVFYVQHYKGPYSHFNPDAFLCRHSFSVSWSAVKFATVYHIAYLAHYRAFLYTNFEYIIKPSRPVSPPCLSLSCGVARKPGILIELSPRIASSLPASCPQALEYGF